MNALVTFSVSQIELVANVFGAIGSVCARGVSFDQPEGSRWREGTN